MPYGYVMTNSKTMKFDVDEPAAQVVRDIFEKYNEGWGYKKIANYLTEKHIPTPRMCEKMRKEANGEECKREAKQTWSLVTISEILSNDFYIGTLRQGKYRRKRINGDEVKQHETDHIVFEIFDNILNKPTLDKNDINLIIDKITVYEDHIDIQLKADIDCLLTYGTLDKPESVSAMADVSEKAAENFNKGTESKKSAGQLANAIKNSKGKVLSVNVISNGDPLEIYTNPDGEVIFKKYSAINEMSEGAAQAAEVISKLGGAPAVVFDKDHVVAVSGVPKKEYSQRRLSPALEELLENRKTFDYTDTTAEPLRAVEGITTHALTIAPILTNGDITGAVAFMATDDTELCTDKQSMLAKAAAMFLGKQIEE